MPNLDGIEVIKALHQPPAYKKPLILLLSAQDSRKLAYALITGANQALFQPIDQGVYCGRFHTPQAAVLSTSLRAYSMSHFAIINKNAEHHYLSPTLYLDVLRM